MDRLACLEAFVRVAESGTFSAAAQTLRLPKSAVSRQVAALEEQLGVRLINRTTRSLSLTEAGRGYLERASRFLADLEDANRADALEAHLAAITGLSASVGFLYSVYDDRRAGRQAIVYRASIGSGEPRSGRP